MHFCDWVFVSYTIPEQLFFILVGWPQRNLCFQALFLYHKGFSRGRVLRILCWQLSSPVLCRDTRNFCKISKVKVWNLMTFFANHPCVPEILKGFLRRKNATDWPSCVSVCSPFFSLPLAHKICYRENSSRFSRVFCEICNGLLQPHAYHLLIPRGFHIQLWVLKILCKV